MTIETTEPTNNPSTSQINNQTPTMISDSQTRVTEQRLHPLRKTENTKAWVLTLLLHFLIAGGLVGYWYFYQRPQALTPLAVEVASANTPPVATTPASTLTTLSTITTLASVTSQPASSTGMSSPNKPLADYVAKQQAYQPAQPFNLPSNNMTSMPMPITNVQQKIITHDAPITKALTSRDIAKNETTAHTDTPSNDNSDDKVTVIEDVSPQPNNNIDYPTKKADATSEQTTPTKTGNSSEKEASNLSKDIDVDNEKLSVLIEQVKDKNQQQIDAQRGSKAVIVNTDNESKPASAP